MKQLIPLILLIGFVIGCPSNSKPPTQAKTDQAQLVVNETKDAGKQLKTISDDINKQTTSIEQKVPEPTKTQIADNTRALHENATKTAVISEKMDKIVVPAAEDVKDNVVDLAAERDKWRKEREAEQANRDNKIKDMLVWLAGAMILGMMVGGAITFFAEKPKLGNRILIYCAIVFSGASAVYFFFDWMMWVVLAVVVLVLAYTAYQLWQENKQNSQKSTLSSKLVLLGEVIKQELTNLGDIGISLRKKLFGDGLIDKGIAGKILNDDGSAEVANIRDSGKIPTAKSL